MRAHLTSLNEVNAWHVGEEASEMGEYSYFSTSLLPGAKECLWISRNLHHRIFSVTALAITDKGEMHHNKRFRSDLTSGAFLAQLACRIISKSALSRLELGTPAL